MDKELETLFKKHNGNLMEYFLGADPRKHKDFIRLGGDPKDKR